MGVVGAKRPGQRSRSVQEDWLAWLPLEVDQLFDATRNEFERSNLILSVALEEALTLCEQGQYMYAKERAAVFAEMFDRLALGLCLVIRTVKTYGSHFGILPNVALFSTSNFRGTIAQRISVMNNLLGKVLFRSRTRFFHKLHALEEIIEELQKETHRIVENVSQGVTLSPDHAWRELEVLGYDLNTCMGETTIVLKSFFCVLPVEELDSFRQMLVQQIPTPPAVTSRRTWPFQEK